MPRARSLRVDRLVGETIRDCVEFPVHVLEHNLGASRFQGLQYAVRAGIQGIQNRRSAGPFSSYLHDDQHAVHLDVDPPIPARLYVLQYCEQPLVLGLIVGGLAQPSPGD